MMRVFLIKIANEEDVRAFQRGERFVHKDIYNFETEIAIGDHVFIYFGVGKARITWVQGLAGYGVISRGPFDKGYSSENSRYFKIEIVPKIILENPISPMESGLHGKLRYQLYDVSYVGAKHSPNQAIVQAENNGVVALVALFAEKNKVILDFFPDLKVSVNSQITPLPKPFLLLAGISGTGKTRWVINRATATRGGLDEKENIEIIPVRPDWHEPTDLLGYISRISGSAQYVATDFLHFLIKAWRYVWQIEPSLHTSAQKISEMVPFWLCLDEMNLAPVEQYFADYLSVLELRSWKNGVYFCEPLVGFEKNGELATAMQSALGIPDGDPLWAAFSDAKGIPLPPNLIVVGTVNMDETTHAFSRKVLDRALTIEFDEVQFEAFKPDANVASDAVPWHGLSAVTDARELNGSIDATMRKAVLDLLKTWNEICADTPFRIAYRTINESLLIAWSLGEGKLADSLDWIIMTKLLPRLEGDDRKLASLDSGNGTLLDRLGADWEHRFADGAWEKTRSARKLGYMSKRLEQTGYTSFWP